MDMCIPITIHTHICVQFEEFSNLILYSTNSSFIWSQESSVIKRADAENINPVTRSPNERIVHHVRTRTIWIAKQQTTTTTTKWSKMKQQKKSNWNALLAAARLHPAFLYPKIQKKTRVSILYTCVLMITSEMSASY